ncbi:MAG: DUF4012 domain-containing protein [Patescibacteria group bacterium]
MKNLLKHKSLSELHQPKMPIDLGLRENKSDTQTGTFSKIDVPQTILKPPKQKKLGRIGLIILILAIFIAGVVTWGAILPVKAVYTKVQKLAQISRELGESLKNQNLEEAKIKLPEVQKELVSTKTLWDSIWLFKLFPFLNVYHNDGRHALEAAGYGLDAVDIAITTIEPYADLLGLKAGSSFVTGSADDRIQVAVKTLDKVTPKITEIGDKIKLLKSEVDAIDPGRYPEELQGKKIRQRLIDGKNLLNETTGLFLNAQPLLEVLPQILGTPKSKRYIVLFQNDKELRPTGGFITAYANFRIESGKMLVEKSDDIYELDGQIKTKRQAPPEILNFHKGVYYFNIRDSNLYPDFKKSMEQFIELYPNKPFDFDGIIAVDTHVLVEALKILGEFNIAGRKFNAETDPRCDCPRVIYELEDYATRPVAYVRETRKDILGALLLEIMKKALGVSPSQYWGQLFQMGLKEINEKHIVAYMVDEKTQKGVESLNMGGRIANGVEVLGYKDAQNWDYLHINDSNMAGAKSNLFVKHFVREDYKVETDGSIIKTITIDYKNPVSPSDCNLERGNLCLNGILRNWVRIYVPIGSELMENKGSQSPKDESAQDLKTYEDLGKTVFEGFVTVRPLGSAQLTFKYRLPFKKEGNKLTTLYQKQPGTDGHEYSIMVNGKQKDKFALMTDKVLTISL